MNKSNLPNETETEPRQRGQRALLFGAYTFLLVWGMAYLVLYFTDRLPF
jgi:hypothetical protein